MSLLALIPARGGSKGIPRKNISELCGKPLIAWSIEEAQKSNYIDRLIVSTEDEEIADISRSYGAEVPFLRPAELSRDETPGMDPVLHTLEQLPGYDWVLLLQPTSPLRTAEDIDGIVQMCREQQAPAAVSICESSKHPNWMFYCGENGIMSPFMDFPIATRRQELSKVFALNGALYLAQTKWLNHTRNFITDETLGYVMPIERSVDIDNPLDWDVAEILMEKMDKYKIFKGEKISKNV
jgi:CMP-N,N'-diacetyllegionaminic acid synthase